jgi:hypothetical protein
MKNQYVGDIGDYTKLALLRMIENAGLSIGVNWYFTTDDENNKDGRHIEYLNLPCDTPDYVLFDTLHDIVKKKQDRTINALMNSGLLRSASFYTEPLVLSSAENPVVKRADWYKESLICLQTADVVFMDPDNGFISDRTSPYSSKGSKYVTYEEAAEYYNDGKTVVVYSHRDRSPAPKYISRLLRIKEFVQVSPDNLICVKAHRFSPRDYLFVIQSEHRDKIMQAINTMLCTKWANYLSYRTL